LGLVVAVAGASVAFSAGANAVFAVEVSMSPAEARGVFAERAAVSALVERVVVVVVIGTVLGYVVRVVVVVGTVLGYVVRVRHLSAIGLLDMVVYSVGKIDIVAFENAPAVEPVALNIGTGAE
jgi:hypothetical protein